MDQMVFRVLNGLAGHNGALDACVRAIAQYGAYVFPAALVVLWVVPGPRPHVVRTAAVIAACGVVLALGLNQALNHLVDRPRPYVAHPVHLLLARSEDTSFPSDHAALAFAVTSGLWPVRRPLAAALGAMGFLLGVSRIVAGVHYPGDVLAGAAVGVLSTAALWWVARTPISKLAAWAEGLYLWMVARLRRLRTGASRGMEEQSR